MPNPARNEAPATFLKVVGTETQTQAAQSHQHEPPQEVDRTIEVPQIRSAYRILQTIFVVIPLIAGMDKFFRVLARWEDYFSPMALNLLGGSPGRLISIAGAIEIAIAIGIARKPRIFAFVAFGWLIGITINLLLTGKYLDLALRDFGLACAAFALGRLSQIEDQDSPASERNAVDNPK